MKTRIGCVAVAGALVIGSGFPVYSAAPYTKDEIVYVNLTHDGGVDAIYVVNSFDTPEAGTILDRGSYREVNNLTTSDLLSVRGDVVSFRATEGKFYYEGVLAAADIPWKITVAYQLDGKPLPAEQLAGQSGHLRIDIGIHQKIGSEQVWRDHYAVQASLSLDSERCRNIQAPEATVAAVGGDKQLSYIILPGKERDFTIEADVTGYEQSGISFNMVPLSLAIDDPDTSEIKDQLYELQDGAVELDDGAVKLDDGASELLDGVEELIDGVDELDDGVDELLDGVVDLVDGVEELRDGAVDLRGGAYDLLDGSRKLYDGTSQLSGGTGTLESGAAALVVGVSQLQGQSPALVEGSTQVKAGLDQLAEAVSGLGGESAAQLHTQAEQLVAGSQSYLDTLDLLIDRYESQLAALTGVPVSGRGTAATQTQLPPATTESTGDIALLTETLTMLRTLRGSYETLHGGVSQMALAVTEQGGSLPQLVQGVDALAERYGELNTGITAYTKGVDQLASGLGTLSDGVIQLSDGIATLKDGSWELRDGAGELYDGTFDLVDGVWKLSDGTADLDDGVRELKDGVVELKDGTADLWDGAVELKDGTLELADGTGELREKTADMDQEIDTRIDEMLEEYRNKEFVPISFVDPSNRNINAVQFVMKTPEISVEEPAEAPIAEEPPLTLWQRFLNLISFLKKDD